MINTIMEMTAIKGLARKAALGLAVGMLLLAPVAAEAHCDTHGRADGEGCPEGHGNG